MEKGVHREFQGGIREQGRDGRRERETGDEAGFTFCFNRRRLAESEQVLLLRSLARLFAKRASEKLGIPMPADD